MAYMAEYIWIDGTEPTPLLRSKTRVLGDKEALPIWGFDGSSTNQAPGKASDCVLRPVASFDDPIRGGDNKLVMAEVLLTDMTPHPTNTRAALAAVAEEHAVHESWFGIEQEYTLFKGSRPARLPGNRRLSRTPGPVLLRRRPGRHLRSAARRGPHEGVHRRRHRHLGHQC